jgi:hypothetical protein
VILDLIEWCIGKVKRPMNIMLSSRKVCKVKINQWVAGLLQSGHQYRHFKLHPQTPA